MSACSSLSCSSTVEPLDASSPSPAPIDSRQQVHFPPSERVDFIVHYGQTDLHCHTFVLHIQSSYFRHVFDALAPSSSPVPPPPSLPLTTAADTDDGARAVVELSPVASPTSSPSSPQPAWRSVLSTAASFVQSALHRMTAHPERGSTKRKREAEQGGEDSSNSEGKDDESLASNRRTRSAAHIALVTTSASTGSSTPALCAHPGVRCVHIPAQRTVISGEAITEADFELFLRHLYFCAHYRFPPFLPADDISLVATPPPTSTLPPYPDLTEHMTSALLRNRPPVDDSGVVKLVWKEALLTLGQYFDCPALLARCEVVSLKRLEHVRHAGAYFDVLYAHQYGLRQWKRRCIELILTDQRMRQRKEYALTALWERQLLLDVLAAGNERLQSSGWARQEELRMERQKLLQSLEQALRVLHE